MHISLRGDLVVKSKCQRDRRAGGIEMFLEVANIWRLIAAFVLRGTQRASCPACGTVVPKLTPEELAKSAGGVICRPFLQKRFGLV
ncbi:hypothetical protein CDAR_51591 [Caerostris darwini]|uniref:Uncharacterized protein n=1 Tax=Caerostris darwini TaxID=1538125 RepID=A0AAV4VTD3_9ARAC|nr:hypothetical protein CDAR_51591 [Caerostris darwini]